MRNTLNWGNVFVLLSCFLFFGCQGTFSQKVEFQSVSVEKAEWVDVSIRLNVGDLILSSGAQQFMNARFVFFQPTRRPEIKYEETGDSGLLTVQQESRSSVGEFSYPGDKNKWNILFSEADPLNLDISVDKGTSFLNLGALKTRRINIECGQGDVFLDLLGKRKEGLLVTVSGGTGNLEIKVPKEIGARMQFKENSYDLQMEEFSKEGEYIVNKAYGSTAEWIDIIVSDHSGPIQLKNL